MKAFLKNKKFVLLLFGAIVLIQYLIMGHSPFLRIPGWPSQELTISYSYGFVRRGLMGSLVAILSQLFHVELFTMILFIQLLGTVVFVGLLFFFFYLVMKESDNTSVVIMILLFLAMGGIGFYFADWGEMDIFMLSVTIIACMLIIKDKYVWLIPFLAAVCVMIHEGYVLMYLGIILALLLYRVTVETDERKKKKYWLCLFSTGLIAAVLFIYFYFFSVSVSKNHIDEIIVNSEIFLQSQVYTRNLKYIYEGTALPNCAMWVDGAPTPNFFIRMFAVVLNILVCLPVISIIVDFWKMVLKNYADSKKTRLIKLCLCAQLLTLPLVLTQTDESRWFYDVVFFNFLFITSVLCIDGKNLSFATDKHFKPSVGKAVLIVFYFIFFLHPDLQFINQFYSSVAELAGRIKQSLPS